MKWYEDPVYIKMCEKAEEIQKHKIDDGDFYFRKLNSEEVGNFYISYTSVEDDYSVDHPDQWDYLHGVIIWLPRQDQLQEMVAVKDSTYANIVPFADFAIRQGIRSRPPQFRSMEQLWLAFVMKKKYNKVWDGEDWVKEGNKGS